MGDTRRARSIWARIRAWPSRWTYTVAGLAGAAISLITSGEVALGVWVAIAAVLSAVVADRSRASPSVLESRVRERVSKLDADRDDPNALASAEFGEAAALFADRGMPAWRVVELSQDADPRVACAALAALAKRDDVPADWTRSAVQRLRTAGQAERFFLLQFLAAKAAYPVAGSLLSQLDEDIPVPWLVAALEARLAAGDTLDLETLRKNVPRRLAPELEAFLATDGAALDTDFDAWRAEIDEDERTRTVRRSPSTMLSSEDIEFLRQVGRLWERPFVARQLVLPGARSRIAAALAETISGSPVHSVLLVGDHGVGKTTLARAAAEQLPEDWVVFEAGAAAIHAGAIWVGELEGRVAELAQRIGHRNVLWLFPNLEDAVYAGQHSRSPRGLLDALLPYIDDGTFRIVAEATPDSYERLRRERPAIQSAFQRLRIDPPQKPEALAIARDALEHEWNLSAGDDVLAEAYELAHRFAPAISPPANLLQIIGGAAARVRAAGKTSIVVSDVLQAVSEASGTPLAILDPSTPLDAHALQAFLQSRVIGQTEAVECVIQRIEMIKARLTDPSRPFAVLLFAGPTGTGKTELAKATAEYLLGSDKRLLRLDMSEFQTPDSLERLLADAADSPQAAPLIAAVRREPLSVVLLDEFEKAAWPIWDAFLQVFDDGRLTDQHGHVVDFRRCIFIMTSNIGSAIRRGAPLGFGSNEEPFRPEETLRAVEQSFRPEFRNRIDRIVVFRPFGREDMRALLDKELNAVLEREGLRSRPWAVIFDESAVDFLIDAGFSPMYGARDLQRAVTDHVLAPIARLIARGRVPEGDQFLYVSAGGAGISVAFVDPDAQPAVDLPAALADHSHLDLRAIAAGAGPGNGHVTTFLLDELSRISTEIHDDRIAARKERALHAISKEGFWEDATRFGVLATIEYLDRLEAALRTAERLGERLRVRNGSGGDLPSLLGRRLYVLDSAVRGLEEDVPGDVFLRIRAVAGPHDESSAFAERLARMYLAWGERRGMRIRPLPGPDGDEKLLAVSGLGAGWILGPERGLHVWERPTDARATARPLDRVAAQVDVVPWPPAPAAGDDALAELAHRAFSGLPAARDVVRRYRERPDALVRDAVRGYRTGKLEDVLGGDFDVVR